MCTDQEKEVIRGYPLHPRYPCSVAEQLLWNCTRRRSWRASMPAIVALLFLAIGAVPTKTLMAQAGPAFLVKDINTVGLNGSSEPWNLFAVGDEVYFTAQERFHGREMWRSDGTPNGTEPGEGPQPRPARSRST